MYSIICLLIGVLYSFQGTSPSMAQTKPDSTSASLPTPHPILAERIDGPANVRDTPRGPVVFQLYDTVMVAYGRAEGNWCDVGVSVEITAEEYAGKALTKGRKLIVDGREIGVVCADVSWASAYEDNGKYWGEYIGFTHVRNVRPETIVENAFLVYSREKVGDRRLFTEYRGFMDEFRLREGNFAPFQVFSKNESWIEDPSPFYRLGLVFHDGRLIGVFHSRPFDLPGTEKIKLDRDFTFSGYKDVEKRLRKQFAARLNELINSVD